MLRLRDLVVYTDYFVICTGESTTQVRAIVENIEKAFAKKGLKPQGVEGLAHAHWVLLDYGDVIVHVFERETRDYYGLDKLWLDAPRIDFDEDKADMGGKKQGEVSGRGH